MNVYLYIGGAYGDDYWTSQTHPDNDQMASWSCGELLIFKIDSDMRAYEPDGQGDWNETRKITA